MRDDTVIPDEMRTKDHLCTAHHVRKQSKFIGKNPTPDKDTATL